jgi:hypothetical protein
VFGLGRRETLADLFSRISIGVSRDSASELTVLSETALWQPNQFDVIHAKGKRQLVKSNDCGISVPLFEAADVLLTKARDVRELLLRQALLLSETLDVPPDQSAHIHTQRSADYILCVYQL